MKIAINKLAKLSLNFVISSFYLISLLASTMCIFSFEVGGSKIEVAEEGVKLVSMLEQNDRRTK